MNEKILKRIAILTQSKNVENDLKILNWLQREQAPWLKAGEVEDCIIFSLVRLYKDHELSWLWHEQTATSQETSIAA